MNTLNKLKILYQLGFETRQPKIFSFHDSLPDVFSHYLELLIYKRYKILSSGELLERLKPTGKFREKSSPRYKEALLAFDDGRRNCWTVIFPLLKKYKVKASFFIIPSRIKESREHYPNLEDYWKGKVSWENLYLSHRREPYLTWDELEIMQSSGLVEVFCHSLLHQVVAVSPRVIDFQHPGVYEMPVYFDEWLQAGSPQLDFLWGTPIYERSWGPLASNVYVPNKKVDVVMNEYVRRNGGFLFFKKKGWRKKLFEIFEGKKKIFEAGFFKKIENKEDARLSIFESKKIIENRLKKTCSFFSLPLYQSSPEIAALIAQAGYKAVLAGPYDMKKKEAGSFSKPRQENVVFLKSIPGFWIKFLSYL